MCRGLIFIAFASLLGWGGVRLFRNTGPAHTDLDARSVRKPRTGEGWSATNGGKLRPMNQDSALRAILNQPQGDLRQQALEEFLQGAATHDPEVLSEALLESAGQIDLQRALATIIPGWMNRSPRTCLAWLENASLETQQKDFLLQNAFAVWARLDPYAALDSAMNGTRPRRILNATFAAAADVDFHAAYSAYLHAGREIKAAVIETMALVAAAEDEPETAGLVDDFLKSHPAVSDQIRLGRNLAVIDRKLADSIISATAEDQTRQQLLAGIFGSAPAVRASGTKERGHDPAGGDNGFSDERDASAEDARAIGNKASR